MGYVKPKPGIGGAINVLFAPCADNPLLWAEAAIPAAMTAIASLVRPNIKGGYKKLLGESWLHSARVGMEEALATPASQFDGATKALFSLAEFADKASWYLFLADLATDTLINWSTQVWELGDCQPPQMGKTGSSISAIGAFPDNTGDWGSLEFQFDSGPFSPQSGPGIVLGQGQSAVICVAASYKNLDGSPASARTRLQTVDGRRVFSTGSSILNSSGTAYHPTIDFAQWQNTTGATTELVWQAQGNNVAPDHEIFFDQGTCFLGGPF